MADAAENLADYTRFGWYTVFILALYETMLLPETMFMTFMAYGGLTPKVVGCGAERFEHLNGTALCDAVHEVTNRTGCIPDLSAEFGSISYEFGLYCEKAIEVKMSISILMIGSLIGSLVFGQSSDFFGRKRMLLISHFGMGVVGFLASRAATIAQFSVIQSIAMFFTGGHSAIMHVFLLENMPKQHRVWASFLFTYSINYVISAIVAYFAADWRTLLLVAAFINLPSFCTLLIAFESPRWLIQKGRLAEAKKTLHRIELINGTATPKRLATLDTLIEKEAEQSNEATHRRKYYFYHLFSTTKMTIYTLVLSYALVCTSMVAYAMVFNLEYISGSIYLNTIIYGAFRYVVNICVGVLDFFVPKAGRKPLHNFFLVLILLLLGIVVFTKMVGWDEPMLVRLCTLCAAGMSSQLYMINAVITSELFPTAIRNLAASFISLFSRLGGVVAPHMFYLSVFWDPLPFVIMFSLVAFNLAFHNIFLPETKGIAMVDHMPKRRQKGLLSSPPLLENANPENGVVTKQ